ncbi:MAG: hypothetical protein JO267_10295 [Alphaproteobacteria bacterium]|nr:hypothetical protein [Alphaproteobacteria bacterium]
MAGTRRRPEDRRDDRELGAWLAFWAQFAVLGLFALIGAFVAGQGDGPGDYICGMLLLLGCVALAFIRLKRQFDGQPSGWGEFLLVDRVQSLWIVIPVFTIIGLIGLFTAAAWNYGSLHDAGIALFVVSGLAVFLSMKHAFDWLDSQH